MKSAKHGKNTSRNPKVAVTNITPHGVWLWLRNHEYFLSFELYPWFEKASVRDISDVRLPQPKHLSWPKLDVDLHVDSLKHPDKFPLIANS